MSAQQSETAVLSRSWTEYGEKMAGRKAMNGKVSEVTESGNTVPLRCSCGSIFARLREDGALIIVSRHHGHECVNVLKQGELSKLRREAIHSE